MDFNEFDEEQQKLFNADERRILALAPQMEALMANPAWLTIYSIGSAQLTNHQERLMNAGNARDMDQFIKGIIYGIRTLLKTPEAILTTRQTIVERLKPMLPEESDAGTVTESPDDSVGTYASAGEDRPHGE